MSDFTTALAARSSWFTGAAVAAWALVLAGAWLGLWRLGVWVVPMIALTVVTVAAAKAWAGWRRERFIREAPLPAFLPRKLREHYPHLTLRDAELVARGLRQFFIACNRVPGQYVAMPSKVVDVMWHEFIVHTRAYQAWCQHALGRFLHHTPAEAPGASARRNDGLRRAWYWACREESINPRRATRLPLLFALDTKLDIPGGYRWAPDCRDVAAGNQGVYCGGDLSGDSLAGDGEGFGGCDSGGGHAGGDGDGGGDGGGCGGD